MADEHRIFIAKEGIGSESGATLESISPSTGEVGGRSSIERLSVLKTIVVHLG